MMNQRPIQNHQLQAALDEVKRIMLQNGLAGACMLVTADEAAFTYGLHAPWSAIQPDPAAPLGFRIRAQSAELGAAEAHRRLEAAVHTICQLADFGRATTGWMEQLLQLLRHAGVEFDHTPYGGEPLPQITMEPE